MDLACFEKNYSFKLNHNYLILTNGFVFTRHIIESIYMHKTLSSAIFLSLRVLEYDSSIIN